MALNVLVVLVLAGYALLWPDDALAPEAVRWETLVAERPVHSEAYLFLLGIDVRGDATPVEAGARLFATPGAGTQSDSGGCTGGGDAGSETGLAQLTQDAAPQCRVNDPGCYETLTGLRDVLVEALTADAELLARYARFLSYDDYVTLTSPSLDEIFPNYSRLAQGSRLRHFRVIADATAGQPDVALEQLYADIDRLRRLLVRADNLILKMVLVRLLSDNLDMLVQLTLNHEVHAPALARLSAAERSMESVVAREFVAMAQLYRSLEDAPNLLSMDDPLPPWAVRALFKPHSTLNAHVAVFVDIEQKALLKADAFAATYGAGVGAHMPLHVRLRNPVGWVLSEIAQPDFARYIARLHDLDAKIVLANAILSGGLEAARALDAQTNPYRSGPAYLDVDASRLCFPGPAEDEQGVRCVAYPIAAVASGSGTALQSTATSMRVTKKN